MYHAKNHIRVTFLGLGSTREIEESERWTITMHNLAKIYFRVMFLVQEAQAESKTKKMWTVED